MVTEDIKTLQERINRGEVDINNQEMFITTCLKALIFELNHNLKLRDKDIPHMILNTGDDIMYLEVKGQDHAIEPLHISNENYVYNTVPRCMVDVGSVEMLYDQLTNPYTRGCFDIEHEDRVYGFTAEFRRMPLKISVSLKYYLDSFMDAMSVTQQVISNLAVVRRFTFTYMGQTIQATYSLPSSSDVDKNITFDGGTTDSKLRSIEYSIEVETNYPVFDSRTAIEGSRMIRYEKSEIDMHNDKSIRVR